MNCGKSTRLRFGLVIAAIHAETNAVQLGLIGFAAYGAMQPNSIEVEITDSTMLMNQVAGLPIRIHCVYNH